jgi:hypothetical protein
MAWLRGKRARTLVGDVACTDPYFAQHHTLGVLPVLAGEVPATRRDPGTTVFVTVAEPRRWFLIRSGVDFAEGIAGLNVLEVGRAAVVEEVVARGGRADHVVGGLLDVNLYRDAEQAERAAAAAREGRGGPSGQD